MEYGPEAWAHLADCLKAAREGRSVAQVAEESGISTATLKKYEAGAAYRQPPIKLWKLISYYNWTPASLRAVLDGGQPIYRTTAPDRPNPEACPACRVAGTSLAPPLVAFDSYDEILEVILTHPNVPEATKRRLHKDLTALNVLEVEVEVEVLDNAV